LQRLGWRAGITAPAYKHRNSAWSLESPVVIESQ